MRSVKLLLLKKKLLLLKKKEVRQRQNKRKRLWVHPINKRRMEKRLFTNLVQELRQDNQRHRKYFRMEIGSFDYILKLVSPHITKQDTAMRMAIPPDLRLAITLHHLAEGASFNSIASHYRLGCSTVSEAVYDTCAALYNVLQPIYLKPLTNPSQWKNIANGFNNRWNFPNCIGGIDGKHIYIQKPRNSGSRFYSYKQRMSVDLLAICDANYNFTAIDVGHSGSCNDAGIWDSSTLSKGLEQGTVNLPEPEALPGDTDGHRCPYMLIGDEAFPLRPNMMRPYPGRALDSIEKKVFNYRLSRARRVMENTFGILVQRWRILLRPIIAKQDKVVVLVKAMCVLHNFLTQTHDVSYSPSGYGDSPGENGEIVEEFWRTAISPLHGLELHNRSLAPAEIGARLADYFVGAGSVPWQITHINRH